MKINKRIIQIFIISSILFITPINTFADTNKDISINPIFTNEDGLWYPGRIESKDFSIENNREELIIVDRMSIQLKSIKDTRNNLFLDNDSKEFKELSTKSIVTLKHEGDTLFKVRLDEIISKDNITLDKDITISPNDKAILNMTIDMLEDMNNDAQGLENIFNIGVSYKVEELQDGEFGEGESPDIDEEYTEDVINPDTDNGKLPQTGGIINSSTLMFLGALAIGTGLVIENKSSSRNGGKDNE